MDDLTDDCTSTFIPNNLDLDVDVNELEAHTVKNENQSEGLRNTVSLDAVGGAISTPKPFRTSKPFSALKPRYNHSSSCLHAIQRQRALQQAQ